MRVSLWFICLLLNTCLFAQHIQTDFEVFKAKADSIATIVDSNIVWLDKTPVVGKVKNDEYKADVFIDRSNGNMYKIIYRLEANPAFDKERIFYYYRDHPTLMIIENKVYYPFNGKILNATGEMVYNTFIMDMLDFEKTCHELVKQIL